MSSTIGEAPAPGLRASLMDSYRKGVETVAARSPSVRVGMTQDEVVRATVADFVGDRAVECLRAHFARQQAAWSEGNFLVEGNPYPGEGGTAAISILKEEDWKISAPIYAHVMKTMEGRRAVVEILGSRLANEGLELVRVNNMYDTDILTHGRSNGLYDAKSLTALIRDREFLKEFKPVLYAEVLAGDAKTHGDDAKRFLDALKGLPHTFWKRRLKLSEHAFATIRASYPSKPEVRALVSDRLIAELDKAEGDQERIAALKRQLFGNPDVKLISA